jgi:hypothetical protein
MNTYNTNMKSMLIFFQGQRSIIKWGIYLRQSSKSSSPVLLISSNNSNNIFQQRRRRRELSKHQSKRGNVSGKKGS